MPMEMANEWHTIRAHDTEGICGLALSDCGAGDTASQTPPLALKARFASCAVAWEGEE